MNDFDQMISIPKTELYYIELTEIVQFGQENEPDNISKWAGNKMTNPAKQNCKLKKFHSVTEGSSSFTCVCAVQRGDLVV